MELADFVTLPTYSLEQCALYILEDIWWKWIYVLVLWGKLGMKWEKNNNIDCPHCIYRGFRLSTIFGTWEKWYYVKFVLVSTALPISTSTDFTT